MTEKDFKKVKDLIKEKFVTLTLSAYRRSEKKEKVYVESVSENSLLTGRGVTYNCSIIKKIEFDEN
jgi:hypothetical protein